MRGPSAKYLYGLTSTFGTSVNVTQAELDAWDREAALDARLLKPRVVKPRVPAILEVERLIEDRQRGR